MSKRRRQKRSLSQTLFWLMSLILVSSMVISLILVALPGPPEPTPTPWPTWTPFFLPSPTPLPPAPSPTSSPAPSPTVEATEPPIGPLPPTETPAVTVTVTLTPSLTVEATEPPIGPLPPTETPTATPTFTTPPASSNLAFRFAVCGDSRGNPDVYRRVLAAVMTDGSEFLIHTGDLVNSGTEAQWQEFAGIMADFELPFYPVPGNHDGLGGKLDGYLAYSSAPAAHYSFDRGSVHFTLADSHNGGIGATELAWLREDLSTTARPIKIVVLHHPPFDPDGTDHIMAYGNEQFMALMAEQAVDYVFTGHIHGYVQGERDGVAYVITGGAGAPLYTQDHPQAFYHYLHVAVQSEAVTIEVIKV